MPDEKSHKFERLVGRLPINIDSLIGLGIQYFISEQDPEEVEFTEYPNGWSITVKTDKERTQVARQVWEQYVDDEI